MGKQGLACPQPGARVTCGTPESSLMVHCSSGGPEMLCRFLVSSGDSPGSLNSLLAKPINDLALSLEKRRAGLARMLTRLCSTERLSSTFITSWTSCVESSERSVCDAKNSSSNAG